MTKFESKKFTVGALINDKYVENHKRIFSKDEADKARSEAIETFWEGMATDHHDEDLLGPLLDMTLTFDEYARQAGVTAIYPDKGNNLNYPILGLMGEAGEVAEKWKKVLRDKNGVLTDEDRLAIAKELGDVQWYVAAVAYELGFSLGTIAQMNIEKLAARQAKGTLQGSGDDR